MWWEKWVEALELAEEEPGKTRRLKMGVFPMRVPKSFLLFLSSCTPPPPVKKSVLKGKWKPPT